NRPPLLNPHHVADLEGVRLVVRVVLLRPAHGLLQERVHVAALDHDDHRLVVLVRHDHALQDALRHLVSPQPFWAWPACFWRAIVLIRAMSRRTWRTRAVFSSWPEAAWKRRLNCSLLSLVS